jgi:methenyltetrahydrofolate cyclohydrolase
VTALLDLPLQEFLDELAAGEPAPGGGAAAAVATAMAAGLLAMVARASIDEWPEARSVSAQAEALRNRVEPLAQADSKAYADVLRLLEEAATGEPAGRDAKIAEALDLAADLPVRIAEAACDVAELGAAVAERGDPKLRPDAAAAVLLAEAATRIGEHLVRVNLATLPDDPRLKWVGELVEAAGRAARRAVGA